MPVALHIIRRLAPEALELRDIQRRILRNDQLVGADLDAVKRSRRLLEVVVEIKRLRQHDLGIVVTRLQGDGLFQPFLRIVQPVGK